MLLCQHFGRGLHSPEIVNTQASDTPQNFVQVKNAGSGIQRFPPEHLYEISS